METREKPVRVSHPTKQSSIPNPIIDVPQRVMWGIRSRLLIGFFAIIFILLIAGGTTLAYITTTKNFTNRVITTELPTYSAFMELNKNIYQALSALRGWMLTHDPRFKIERAAAWDNIGEVVINIDTISHHWTQPDFLKNWQEIKLLLTQFKLAQDKIEAMSDPVLAGKALLTGPVPIYSRIFDLLDGPINVKGHRTGGMFEIQYQRIQTGTAKITQDMNAIQFIEYILLGLGIILSLIVVFSTIKALAALTRKIIQACHNMVSTLEEVRQAVTTQSSGASQQASAVNEITSSLGEIEQISLHTIEEARSLGDVSERTSEKGQLGLNSAKQCIEGMQAVRNKVQVIAQTILDLSHQTQQVCEITTVVNSLAQQLKMLSLNASIEAAKAGEAGKGFSVVAMEVKNLAEQSEESTIQVQKILEDIRLASEKAVIVTEEGIKGVDNGATLVTQMGAIVHDLSEVIHEANTSSQHIQAAIRQGNVGIEQITEGMNEINQVTSSFVISVSQTAEAVTHLTNIAKNLKACIEMYKF